jgi:hypothetical protein
VPRFVYKIVPASLIPEGAEYIFESGQDFKAGDEFERAGRRLSVELVEDDDTGSQTETDLVYTRPRSVGGESGRPRCCPGGVSRGVRHAPW